MKDLISILAWAAALSLPMTALAEDASPGGGRAEVRAEVTSALESQAALPDRRPTLPDQASDRAREVQSSVAFGQKGAAERAAHRAAEAARSDSATAAARKAAAAAADRAGQKSQAAATERRAEEVRQGQPPSRPARGKSE
jgi:hypothetical protein